MPRPTGLTNAACAEIHRRIIEQTARGIEAKEIAFNLGASAKTVWKVQRDAGFRRKAISEEARRMLFGVGEK